jgi:hypothetical protein
MTAQDGLRIVHAHGDRITVTEPTTGVDLSSYVYRPESAWEAPKPYLHPLRTLAGDVVTDYRPNDHRWHKGLQMTASHLSGSNLWGGNTYVHGEGYLELPERVGSMAHVASTRSPHADGRPRRHRRAADLASVQRRRCGPTRSAGSRCTTWTRRPVPGR